MELIADIRRWLDSTPGPMGSIFKEFLKIGKRTTPKPAVQKDTDSPKFHWHRAKETRPTVSRRGLRSAFRRHWTVSTRQSDPYLSVRARREQERADDLREFDEAMSR